MELADLRCLAVLGLRRSGRPAALLARRELPATRVVALDEGAPPSDDTVEVLEAAGVEVLTGPAAVLPEDAGLLVKSPGVPDSSAAVQEALRRGVPLWSEVELACRFLPNPLIGITGTNGKTTTTELAGAIFRDARRPVAVGGNIGFALAAMPGGIPADATVVAELSSFQLEHIVRFRPAVAVLLNLAEDHIDRHGTYAGYVDAKLRIFENQTADDVALLCADDDGILAELAAGRLTGAARRGWFSGQAGRDQGPGGEALVGRRRRRRRALGARSRRAAAAVPPRSARAARRPQRAQLAGRRGRRLRIRRSRVRRGRHAAQLRRRAAPTAGRRRG